MNWNALEDISTLEEIKEISSQKPILIFKHSSRCGISSMALNRLQRNWQPEEMSDLEIFFLDLIKFRQISDAVAQMFDVKHQSPQVLLIKDRKCFYDTSHMGISYPEIKQQLTT